MKFRLWPRSLVGQLVFAVAVMLFVAQAINFALLVRGQRQQFLAHGGGMAVARIIDAVERDRRGDFRARRGDRDGDRRSEEHTSELQSLMRISYAVFCLKKKTKQKIRSMYNTINYKQQQFHTYED